MREDRNIIKNNFFKLFSFTHRVGNKMLYLAENKLCIMLIIMIITGVCAFSVDRGNPIAGIIFFIVTYFMLFIMCAKESLLSAWGFMTLGSVYWCIIAALIYLTLSRMVSVTSNLIAYVIFAVTWIMYSLFANNKVAMLANQIHSTILALVVLSKDVIFAIIPSWLLETTKSDGETFGNVLEKIFLSIFSPFLAVNLIALFMCILKGYWIEKYNNNQDTGQKGINVEEEIETIKENNKQLYKRLDELTERVAQLEKKLEGKN